MSEREQDPKADFPPQIAEKLRQIEARKAAIEAERATRAAAESIPPSPEDVLREEEAELARMEREEVDAKAWRDALAKYGKGRVARIQTPDGLVILRTMTLQEQDANGHRVAALDDDVQRTMIARDATLDTVVHPSKESVRNITTRFPGLWVRMYAARDALAVGEADELAGKA